MEKDKDILISRRSAGECVKAGYRLYFDSFKQVFKGSWLTALAYAVVCGALGAMYHMSLPVVIALVIVGGLAELAFYYHIVRKFLLDGHSSLWSIIKNNFCFAMRYLGLLFAVVLTSAIIIVTVNIVVLLPCILIVLANHSAHLGHFYGDQLGMPSYITPLTMLVCFIAGFIQAYIRSTALFTLYYAFGSIAARKTDNNAMQQKTSK